MKFPFEMVPFLGTFVRWIAGLITIWIDFWYHLSQVVVSVFDLGTLAQCLWSTSIMRAVMMCPCGCWDVKRWIWWNFLRLMQKRGLTDLSEIHELLAHRGKYTLQGSVHISRSQPALFLSMIDFPFLKVWYVMIPWRVGFQNSPTFSSFQWYTSNLVISGFHKLRRLIPRSCWLFF